MATHKDVQDTPKIVHDLSERDEHIVIPFPTGRTRRRAITPRPAYEEDIVSGF